MNNKEVDLVVIGAGATGSSIAYEATKKGLKVVLIDSGDIGGGTSCRSTKLLHGGVRYLELAFKTLSFDQLSLVREALIERWYWLNQAPFLATPIELALPSDTCFSHLYFRIGLELYDALSGGKSIKRSRSLSGKELLETMPLLQKKSSGGVVYSDGKFNDARLNLLIALSAEKAGSIIRSYCKVVDFEHNKNGTLKSVICQNYLGYEEKWTADIFVNAAGINVDKIRKLADPNTEPKVITSRGMHIVLEDNLCPKNVGLLIPSTKDGRVLFVLPFFNKTLIGTTDSPCEVKDAQKSSNSEKEYLISHIKEWFPTLNHPKIISSWSGGRPLIKPSKDVVQSSKLVREHQIETLPCGLISAMGGKWTTCRSIALDTLKAVEKLMNKPLSITKDFSLIGTSKQLNQTKILLKSQLEELREYLPKTSCSEKQLLHLQGQYGLAALEIIANSPMESRVPLSEVIPICEAELNHAIKYEHARTPTDLLARRCRLAMVDIDEAERLLSIANEHLVRAKLSPGHLNLEK